MNVIFESENIIYTRPSLDLVPEYLEMVNDIENVARFIGDRREPLSEKDEIDYIKDKLGNDATMFSMFDKKTNEFIGNIEFFNRTFDAAEWGIVITTKMQNKGYGREALMRSVEYGFNELGLNRIFLAVYVNNHRAIHVYEQCGFKEFKRDDVDIFMEIVKDS